MNWLLHLLGLRTPFEPHLIDVHEYETDLLLQRDKGIELRPVPDPLLWTRPDRDWTCEEREAMERNRRLLQEIYKRVRNRT